MGTRLDRKGIREVLGWSGELGLVLATDTAPEQALPALVQAMDRADEAVGLPSPDRDEVLNGPVLPTPAGIRFYLDPFDEVAWDWLDQLAKNLTAAKISGTITAETAVPWPTWMHGPEGYNRREPGPVMAIAYPKTSVDDDPAATDALQTRIVDHILDWASQSECIRVAPDMADFALPTDNPRPSFLRVRNVDRLAFFGGIQQPWQRRDVSWSQFIGDRVVSARLHAPALTRTQQLEELTGLLTGWDPETAMYGFLTIRQHPSTNGMISLLREAEPPALAGPKQYYLCADNYDAIVADAHGTQLLTDRHLSRARDLSNWEVTEITPHRYLVRAQDLEPWYAGDTPDPEVVAQARSDFGDMILTPETVPHYKSARWGGPGHLPG